MAENLDFATKTDNQLVALTLANQDNFLYLVNRYDQKILRYILRISNVDADSAQDLLQEIFIKAYQNLNSFDQNLKFSSWLYRIAHNHVISSFRKNQARPQTFSLEVNEQILENLADDSSVVQKIDQQFLRDHLEKILNRLDKKYREVIILRYFEDKDYKEISDIIRKPVGTVGTLINRAKKQIEEIIKNYDRQ
ncbi:MAG: sigma-70 family RNA polymerase sigma factor [Candidatus Buchananbacteria bacterium]|nr:sigma-70 family RNA polymerase sigma factor [Candidatus Buchananbacteria bacterium]